VSDTGPTGCGKTHRSLVAETLVGALHDSRRGRSDLRANHRKETLVEKTVYDNEATRRILPTAMKRGAIVYLDEPNAIPSEVLFYLFSAMDHRRSITFDDGTTLEAAPDFVVLSAMNEGHGYAGTALLNHAFRARSIVIDMSYLPQIREQKLIEARTKVAADIAKKLTEAAATLRASKDLRTPIGTRSLIDCATLIGLGVAPEKAAQVAIVNQVPSQFANERKSVQDVLAAFFGGKIS
jgi:MoxR-like ATPase